MNLDEAIDRYTNNAEYERIHGSLQGCLEFRQLAEWLKELKRLREQTSWIPVSERLPEICEKDCHGDITFSKTVLTTQIYGDGYVHVGIDKYTTNKGGGWLMEVPFDNPEECCEVIAWMPLPKPYEPQESEDKE